MVNLGSGIEIIVLIFTPSVSITLKSFEKDDHYLFWTI